MPKIQTKFPNNGFLLHSSAVKVANQALLFLGHSSSGKSTISQLLSKKYPIISDDKVWIFQKSNGEWFACEGEKINLLESSQDSTINCFPEYTILTFLRIFKSNETSIKPLSTLETCKYLIDAVFEIDSQRKQEDFVLAKKWFSSVAEISKKYVGWHLTFRKDVSIINLINEIFEKKMGFQR